jgi:acyl-CoA reductase-like NAD-dependent aldehyde dehydrogenase
VYVGYKEARSRRLSGVVMWGLFGSGFHMLARHFPIYRGFLRPYSALINKEICHCFSLPLFPVQGRSNIAMADATLANLQATALTARCHNPLFRQKQLKALHDTLRQSAEEIRDAIVSDSCASEQEATTEVAFALDLVKRYHSSINAPEELEAEYLVGHGKNDSDRRVPWGVTFIEPHKTHTPFFSAITALCAALVAGNCVALKVRSPCI